MTTIRQRIADAIDTIRRRRIRPRDISELTERIARFKETEYRLDQSMAQMQAVRQSAAQLEAIREELAAGNLERLGQRLVFLPGNMLAYVPPRIRTAGLRAYAARIAAMRKAAGQRREAQRR